MRSKSGKKCEDCLHWDDDGDGNNENGFRTGKCMRYPPVHLGLPEDDYRPMHREWGYPTVGNHWWCGEWQPDEYSHGVPASSHGA